MALPVSIHDLIVFSAASGLRLQAADGSMPAGNNGPWRDIDTPVRTTAHWALIFHKAHAIGGCAEYSDACMNACGYLQSPGCRPGGKVYHCRRKPYAKDECNGLIGQAWAVEPLLLIGARENIAPYVETARATLMAHNYDQRLHLWENTEIDGRRLAPNSTLNQQIWFSAMALICGDAAGDSFLTARAADFFGHLPDIIDISGKCGLFRHNVKPPEASRTFSRRGLRALKSGIVARSSRTRLAVLSAGYLPFILQGVSLAYEYCPEHAHWENAKLRQLLRQACIYVRDHIPYGFPAAPDDYRWSYNPVGIEMAYVLQTMNEWLELAATERDLRLWLNTQIAGHYDFESGLMNRNTIDPAILSARLYEAVNLKNYPVDASDCFTA